MSTAGGGGVIIQDAKTAVKDAALSEVNKGESWLKKYASQFLVGLGCGVLLTHFVLNHFWK